MLVVLSPLLLLSTGVRRLFAARVVDANAEPQSSADVSRLVLRALGEHEEPLGPDEWHAFLAGENGYASVEIAAHAAAINAIIGRYKVIEAPGVPRAKGGKQALRDLAAKLEG